MKVSSIWGPSDWHRHRIGESVNEIFKFNKDTIGQVALRIPESLEEAEEWWKHNHTI